MKRLSKDKLRELKIINSWDIAKISGIEIFIGYTPPIYGRASMCAKWQVYGIGFKTDPKAAWYDGRMKTFDVWKRGDNAPQLAEAIKWCEEKYGITEWEKDPFGGYQAKGALEIAVNRQLGVGL